MDSRDSPGDAGVDWNEMALYTSNFDDSMPAESPYGNSAFNEFTTFDAQFNENPIGLTLRTPSKSGHDTIAPTNAQNPSRAPPVAATSAESSSQDSSSDSSSRRKRKTNETSPISDSVTEVAMRPVQIKAEDAPMPVGDMRHIRSYESNFSQPMHNLSVEQSLSQGGANMVQFDFHSAASSPIKTRDFDSAMSLDAQVNANPSVGNAHFNQESPVQTINPGMFTLGGSGGGGQRDQTSVFSTPSSDSPDTYGANQAWNQPLTHNMTWPSDFTSQLTSPVGMAFTPSPGANNITPATVRAAAVRSGRSPLHIAPISTKSRVETQINVIMTLEQPPPGVEQLHLPLHTIAKSKLLAKEEYDQTRTLELHTMLVCTSAMQNPQMKEKALRKAASTNNGEIQRRAELARDISDEEKNDPKSVPEEDKPANGGEVRICSNCIQRERKRAGRKKTKREEEQQHWERFETERVVVFNSNELLQFKLCDSGQQPQRDEGEPYIPPEGALHVSAAMRIACYCRHQSEKEGFQVIFTLKDHHGAVIAQQMSDSILITDDHKTHPQSFSAAVPGEPYYQGAAFLPNGMPMSQSMIDMSTHVQPFTSSRSAGNLQALTYQAQFNPHSHVHQLPPAGYNSQTTSATMTPTSLSRPASPSSAGQAGPNKKRKSSQFHRKVPSGLTMTPRVDTSQPPSSNLPSAVSMGSQFSPNFPDQLTQSYMTIPTNNGPAQYFGSGPPTPSEHGPFNFSQPQIDMSRIPNNQAYFSHPSSAVPSRASSPVLQQARGNMAAYARQANIQTPTNSVTGRPGMFSGHVPSASVGNEASFGPTPLITRIAPTEGPCSGQNEVVIFGENFVQGINIAFDEHVGKTQFLNSTSLIVMAPAGRPGPVHVSLRPPLELGQPARYPELSSKPIYRYVESKEEVMVMALKYISEQQLGNPEGWQSLAQQSATNFMQSRISRAGLSQQGFPGGHRVAAESTSLEELILNVLDVIDVSERPCKPDYDLAPDSGSTMLSLACSSGMHRVAAGLLARGANADSRDHGGYTPLMHAALHGHAKVFQLLIARGADPTIRNLTGYSAIELAAPESRDELLQILWSTRRRRHSRPSLQWRLSCGSVASSKASWDIASASYYESEVDGSEQHSPAQQPSRRSSVHDSATDDFSELLLDEPFTQSPYAALVAWRDALAAQICQFQSAVSWHMPNFQLPPLPNLTDYRRLSSFMAGKTAASSETGVLREPLSPIHAPQPTRCFWDVFSASGSTPVPSTAPPAYHDIFPDRKAHETEQAGRPGSVATIVIKAVVGQKSAVKCDSLDWPSSEAKSSLIRSPTDKTDCLSIPAWLVMPLLVVVTSTVMHLLMPFVSKIPAQFSYSSRDRAPVVDVL